MTDQPEAKDAEKERQAKREKFIQAVVAKINWDEIGLIPAVTQDIETGLVLQIGWLNADALRLTIEKREVHFWERNHNTVVQQGAENDAVQKLASIYVDCDASSVLLKVMATGPACHTNSDTCFYRPLEELLGENTGDD